MFREIFENVRSKSPVIHCITNYVTVNDCANILLACGASPIMADDSREVKEITSLSQGLVLNLGTLNLNTVLSMSIAGQAARELHHPVLLDPVGAGASQLRTQTALSLIQRLAPTVIRGNVSEIKNLITGKGTTRGVDAALADTLNDKNLDSAISLFQKFAAETKSIIAVSGPIDLIVDGQYTALIYNGHPMMPGITGSGCMLSCLITAFLAANPPDQYVSAVTAACCMMGLAGERAGEKLNRTGGGTATFRQYLLDEISLMNSDVFMEGINYESR